MKYFHTILLSTAMLGLSGCCMKSLELKPKMDALDLKTAKVGSLSSEIVIQFKECCPNKEQEKIALSIQSKITELYNKLLNDQITLEQYNQKIDAAKNAIENVVLVCSPKSKLEIKSLIPLPTTDVKMLLPTSEDKAWIELEKVAQEL